MAWSVLISDALSEDCTKIPGLEVFDRRCRQHDHHASFDEHTLLSLHGQRRVPHARLTVRDGTNLVGCAVLTEALDSWYAEVAVLPSHRQRGLGRALTDAATEHVASQGCRRLRTWVQELTPAVSALGRDAQVDRTLLVFRRCLNARRPDVLTPTRPLRDTERDAWLALSNAAFVGHPENGGWTRRDLNWRIDLPWTPLGRWPLIADDNWPLKAWVRNRIGGDRATTS